MNPIFFPTQADFRAWLAGNYNKASELLVGFYKVGSGKPSMTWPQSVDEALCFGWIDGVRRSVDADSYCIRFTPRKSTSIWSAVNIRKMDELIQQDLMQPPGLAVFAKRQEAKSKIYAYEQPEAVLSKEFEDTFKSSETAWTFFQKQAPSYRKRVINWVMTAKQEITKVTRLENLIKASAEGRRI